jgi:hypothetical protein
VPAEVHRGLPERSRAPVAGHAWIPFY